MLLLNILLCAIVPRFCRSGDMWFGGMAKDYHKIFPQCPHEKIVLTVTLIWQLKKNCQTTTKLKSLSNAPLIQQLMLNRSASHVSASHVIILFFNNQVRIIVVTYYVQF